jgi:hypothetical protein
MFKKLLSANPARIGRFDAPPTSDAMPASLVDGTPGELKADLIALLGKENVFHRAIDLVRYTSDGSPYRLVPQVVVQPRTIDDIVVLFQYCRKTGRHATFRAAGTSLNGQSQSDDILIDVRQHWYGAKVEDDGRRVRVRPGMILGHINSMLEPHGRRVGPDPASGHACTIGGVIALAHRIASFPAHAIAHAKAAVDTGAFRSMAEGLLVEAHESDLSVASEVTQARVKEVLTVGAETYDGELEMDYLSRLSPVR